MNNDTISDERSCAETRDRIIRKAEEVLAQAYRFASRRKIIESQLRVRETVVREMRRRLR